MSALNKLIQLENYSNNNFSLILKFLTDCVRFCISFTHVMICGIKLVLLQGNLKYWIPLVFLWDLFFKYNNRLTLRVKSIIILTKIWRHNKMLFHDVKNSRNAYSMQKLSFFILLLRFLWVDINFYAQEEFISICEEFQKY